MLAQLTFHRPSLDAFRDGLDVVLKFRSIEREQPLHHGLRGRSQLARTGHEHHGLANAVSVG
jgi:hypothetical protein